MEQSPSCETLVICQLVKKFPTFHGTRSYYHFKRARPYSETKKN